MNGSSVLLDTNIVLYLLAGDKVLADMLFNKKLNISFITQLELLGYKDISKQEQKEIMRFLDDCIITDINNTIKQQVVRIRRTRKFKLPDSIILATAAYLGIPVISSDVDFIQADGVDVISYEKS